MSADLYLSDSSNERDGAALLRFLVSILPNLKSVNIHSQDSGDSKYRLVVNDPKSKFELTELRTIAQYFGYLQNIHDISKNGGAKSSQFVDVACSFLERNYPVDRFLNSLNAHLQHNSFLDGESFEPNISDYTIAYVIAESLAEAAKTGDSKSFVDKFSNVLRWYNQIQNAGYAAGNLSKIEIVLPSPSTSFKFLPTMSELRESGRNTSGSVAETKEADVSPKQIKATPAKAKKGESENAQTSKNKQSKKQSKKQKKENKKGKAKPKSSKKTAPAADLFAELDIRVAKIISAQQPEGSDKVFTEKIDCGEESGPRDIASGLVGHYTADQLSGRMVLVVCNLKPRAMKFQDPPFNSNGMVLCASSQDKSKVELIEPPEGAKIGERVTFSGLAEAAPAKPSRVEKKGCLRKSFQFMKTNKDQVAVYKGEHIFTTSAGPCKSKSLAGANVG